MPTNKVFTSDNTQKSEATNEASVKVQWLPLETEIMFISQYCANGAVCDAVQTLNRALIHRRFVTRFHGTHVIVLLFTHCLP